MLKSLQEMNSAAENKKVSVWLGEHPIVVWVIPGLRRPVLILYRFICLFYNVITHDTCSYVIYVPSMIAECQFFVAPS